MRLVHVQAPLALVAITALLAQQAPPPASSAPVALKSTTRLVQVSVIAQDGKGQPVMDLKKDDFRVRVNGKDQAVKVFSMDASSGLPSDVPAAEKPIPNVFSNRTAVASGQISSITIVLLDTLNTSLADQMNAKAQVIRYLRTLHPGDHIGLYSLGNSLRILHDYTADSTELLSRLEDLKGKELPDMSGSEPNNALHNDSLLLDALQTGIGGAGPGERSFYTVNRIIGTLKAIEFIANHLAQTPGRKNLVWVSGGFPLELGINSLAAQHSGFAEQRTFTEEINETVRAVNDANMAIYPVDARGAVTDPQFNSAEQGTAAKPTKRPRNTPPVAVSNQEPMQELASRTGGRAYLNTNDLAKAIHTAVDDSRVTYMLGFYPVDESFDGKFHKIDVDLVSRKGIHLRYRKGFFDLLELPQDEKTRKTELRDAAWSPLDASGIGVLARVAISKTKPGALEVVLGIDTTQVSLEKQSDNWVGRLDVLFVQGDENGNQYGGFDDTINFHFNSAEYAKFLKGGFVYTKMVNRSDRAQHLRIILRDAATGAIGSVTIPFAKIS